MNTAYLSEAFQDGLQREDPNYGLITLHHHTLGELVLTSGKVVACDPFVNPEGTPFAVQVSPGRYPVIVSVAALAKTNDQRIAYAMLKVSDQLPARWEMATTEGQNINELEEDEIFCYPVDSGTGCFMDTQAGQHLLQRGKEGTDQLLGIMNQTYMLTWSRADMRVDDVTGANIIAFSSGWGDGCYASYWGYDADGKIACLVTDFGVLGPDEEDDDSSD